MELSKRYNLFKHVINRSPADLLLKDLQIVDVNTGTIFNGHIAIKSGVIIAVSEKEYPAKETINMNGKFAVPAFMDAHMHFEPTLLLPRELSKLLVPHGVLSLFADLMEFANVFGPKGIDLLLGLTKGVPLRVFVEVPSRVPTAEGMETTGGKLGLEETNELLKKDFAASLGELNFQNLFTNPEYFLKKIDLAKKEKKIVNGHAPHLSGHKLFAYHLSGISDDHESTMAEEVIEKLRVGMKVFVREGSTERNLDDIIKGILGKVKSTRHLLFCTDDKFPDDILREGHIDYNIRRAIELGIDPVEAIQMATINIAEHFHLDDVIGSLSVGRVADIVILNKLETIDIHSVFFEGALVYHDNKLDYELPEPDVPEWALHSININKNITPEDFLLKVDNKATRAKVRVIELIPDQIINKELITELPVVNGYVRANPNNDILHISVVDRYKASKNISKAFVKGFGIKNGAIGSSFAHDHHNIVIVGDNPEDMLIALKNIESTQGGLTVVSNGKTLAHLELPVGGLVSLKPYNEVLEKLDSLNRSTAQLGSKLKAPFMQLQFITLPSVPRFGITDLGLVDSLEYKLISPIIEIQ
ncbi:MAG: adenine deaminase [Candidatus Asgardarchaeia archaeon]